MEQRTLAVEIRDEVGKGAARRSRSAGRIPAVFYGKGIETVSLTLDPKALRAALATASGANTLLKLEVPCGGPADGKVAIVKATQVHPVSRAILHADLYEIHLDRALVVDVPVRLTGKAAGIATGGILEWIMRTITVECLPLQIPAEILVDVSPLEVGQSLHVSEVGVPPEVRIVSEAGQTVVTVVAPMAEVAPAVAEGEAEAQPAEGEAAAAGAAKEGEAPAKEGKEAKKEGKEAKKESGKEEKGKKERGGEKGGKG